MEKQMFCFPGFTKKAISFTIDDGNVRLDKKFIDIVKPAGIFGTFNLCGKDRQGNMTDEEYREFYRGFEIANHCVAHPKVITEEMKASIVNEPFDPSTANTACIYPTDMEGVYHKYYTSWWGTVATEEAYCRLVKKGRQELESVFGKGNIRGFVWPYGTQDSDVVKEYLYREYESVRRTGEADFELPGDRRCWSYNATHKDLIERAEEFSRIEDDGKLRFFCFGVHSHDFENASCWHVLEAFAQRFGNRREDYWYATVGQVFDYEDAINAATVEDGIITNNSDIPIYLRCGGEYIILPSGESCKI